MGRRRSFFQGQVSIEEPTVNLTPLIDVVFVILIMFIVIAPLLELDRVNLANAPQISMESTQSVKESSLIAIHVHQNNSIYFNNRQVTTRELVGELKQAKINYPGVSPQVFHDKQAHFGTYQEVKNAAEEAGFSQIDIILKPS